jgi:hypothetical protein
MAISILLAPQFASGSFAEGRDNPFAPPSSAEQEQARQDERIRKVLIDATPDIEAKLMQGVSSSIAASEVRMKKRLDEMSTQNPAGGAQAGGLPGVPTAPGGPKNGAAPAVTGKDGKKTDDKDAAKFISCVNGKALYRDKDNTLFQVSGAGANGVDPCSR